MGNGLLGVIVHSESFEPTFEPPILKPPEFEIIYDDNESMEERRRPQRLTPEDSPSVEIREGKCQ